MSDHLPIEFGGSWQEFTRDWCLGVSLARSRPEVTLALSTLRRVFPAEVARLAEASARGVSVVSPAVELGELLQCCEPIASFGDVLRRLLGGERSAYSELVLGRALRGLSFHPRFEVPIDGHVLDAECLVDVSRVYFEVVAPDVPDASARWKHLIAELVQELRVAVSNCRVEVELYAQLERAGIVRVVQAIRDAPGATWTLIGDLARARRVDAGNVPVPIFDGGGLTIGDSDHIQGGAPTIIVGREASDQRAKRVFNDEYHHFSDRVANVLVVNVSAVPGGFHEWPRVMSGLLQARRNRRVGAIVFFQQGNFAHGVRRRWRALANKHAHIEVPGGTLIPHRVAGRVDLFRSPTT